MARLEAAAAPDRQIDPQIDQFVDFLIAFGANIDLGARRLCDGIDARAAFDQAHVHSGFWQAIQTRFRKQRHRAAKRVHRIAQPVIAPAMSAGTGKGDLESPAA